MKTKIIILFLFINVNLYSQVKVSGYIETGYYGIQNSLNQTYFDINGGTNDGFTNINYMSRYENIIRFDKKNMYADIALKLSYKNIYLEQNLLTSFQYEDGYSFTPLEISYKTRLYYEWKSFIIGIEHMCLHPIINEHNEIEFITRRLSHDKIFLRFNFGNN